MMLSRKQLAIGLSVAAGVGLGIVAFQRTDLSPAEKAHRDREAFANDLVERGQREFKTIRMTPIKELGSLPVVRALVDKAQCVSEPKVGPKSGLLDQVAAFVYYRFVDSSVEDYKRWRASTGRELIPLEELKRLWHVDRRHLEELGEPISDTATSESTFDRFWIAAPKYGDGKRWPVGVSASSKGLLIACGPFDWMNKSNRPALSGEMSRDLWIGDIGGTLPPWWQSPGSRNGAVPAHLRRTECAEVGIILEYSDGSRRPLVLTFLWDPKVPVWALQWVNIYNYPLELGGRIEY